MNIIVPWFDFLQEKHRCLTSWRLDAHYLFCCWDLIWTDFNNVVNSSIQQMCCIVQSLYAQICSTDRLFQLFTAHCFSYVTPNWFIDRFCLDFSLSVVCFNYILKKELKFSSLIMRNSTKLTFQSQVIEKWFLLSASICNCTSCDSTRMHKSQLNLEKLSPKRHLAYQKRDKWLTY